MAYPKHPENILIKNKFYPTGLREIDTWSYYQSNRHLILNECRFRDMMLFIATDVNKYVVVRSGKKTNYIRLNQTTYDDYIHGRVLSIHSTMKSSEDIAIIDIDTDKLDLAKEATNTVYKHLQKFNLVEDLHIRYTGQTSFHIYCNLKRKVNIDRIRIILEGYLYESRDITNNYMIAEKRRAGQVNIDLASNKYRGGFITLNSLSVLGLKCMEVDINELHTFKYEMAKINKVKLK